MSFLERLFNSLQNQQIPKKEKSSQNEIISLRSQSKNIDKVTMRILSRKIVKLYYEGWQHNNMKTVCERIKQWKIQELWACHGKVHNIVKNIQNISFPSLRTLDLDRNGIQSIENFHLIHLPCLQVLSIQSNAIRNFNVKNVNSRHLSEIYLSENKIVQMDIFDRFFSTQELILSVEGPFDSDQINNNLWIMKIQPALKILGFNSTTRIKSQALIGAFNKRYPASELQVQLQNHW